MILPVQFATAAATILLQASTQNLVLGDDNMFNFRYNTAYDIPDQAYRKNKVIYGKTIRVIDGDTIRVRHLPFYPLKKDATYDGLLSENTLSIRAYAVDAPEIGKFGNPSMPYASEAKDFTQKMVGDKVVEIKLLRKDQYGRAVAKVQTKRFLPFLKKDLTMELAKSGYGTLYTGGGAEYDGNRDKIEKAIERAKKGRKGLWVDGEANVQSPAEYKRSVKQAKKAGNNAGSKRLQPAVAY